MTCAASLRSGRMVCLKCVTHWDANDPHPPECKPYRKPKRISLQPPTIVLIRGAGARRGPKKYRLDEVRILHEHEIGDQTPEIGKQVFDYVTAHPAWGFDFQTNTWQNHGV
jgi:hypothetical protein